MVLHTVTVAWCCINRHPCYPYVSMQILGKDRDQVSAVGKALGLNGTYLARSYIEQVRAAGVEWVGGYMCLTSISLHGSE